MFIYYLGLNSKTSSRTGKNLSGLSSKVSSTSVPQTPRSEGEILQAENLKNFSFNELKTATRNFRPDSVLGEGGFGSVFKGWIDEHSLTPTRPGSGIVIAVKRLNQEGFQGHREWLVSNMISVSWVLMQVFLDLVHFPIYCHVSLFFYFGKGSCPWLHTSLLVRKNLGIEIYLDRKLINPISIAARIFKQILLNISWMMILYLSFHDWIVW